MCPTSHVIHVPGVPPPNKRPPSISSPSVDKASDYQASESASFVTKENVGITRSAASDQPRSTIE